MSSGVKEDTTGTLSGRDGYSQFLAQSSIIRTVIINMWELWERVRSEVQTPGCSLHFIAKQRNRNGIKMKNKRCYFFPIFTASPHAKTIYL